MTTRRRLHPTVPDGLTRRAFLAIGGLTLLSACEVSVAEGGAPGAVPVPVPSATPPPRPSPQPSPSESLPALPVQSKPEYSIAATKVPAGLKTVALTIDDGPHPRYTPQVLEILREHDIKATFFMIGSNAAAHPDVVRAVAAGGHHIGSHTWSHADLRTLSPAGARAEVERGLDAVTAAADGHRPSVFRAPYGNWSSEVFKVCAALGQRSIAWSVDPRDWDTPGAHVISSRVMEQVGPRSIVLNHDGGGDRSQTVAALRAYLPRLMDAGYHFVGV